MDTTYLVRTTNGEYFIGMSKEPYVKGNDITLHDVRNLVPQVAPGSQQVGVAAANVIPFAIEQPKEITLHDNNIIAVVEEIKIIPGILNGYKSEITGLDLTTAKKPDIIV